MSLVETSREWVLSYLPYDRGDAALVAYLAGLDAYGLLVVYHNWIARLVKPFSLGWFTSQGTFKENPLATRRADSLAQDHRGHRTRARPQKIPQPRR